MERTRQNIYNNTGLHMNTTYQSFSVKKVNDATVPLDIEQIRLTVAWACTGLHSLVDSELVVNECIKNIYDGIPSSEISQALVLATSAFIEKDPVYSKVASRLLLKQLFKSVTGTTISRAQKDIVYRQTFIEGITSGIENHIFDERMGEFDLDYLVSHLSLERDDVFEYMGLRTLFERYFMKNDGVYFELPQSFWMRVAMGVSFNEPDKNNAALECYNLISTLRYVPSTPTLLHSGLTHPQLSSCYLTTVEDDLHHIFKCYGDNAQLSKWSGGVATDWSNIRACGAMVKSIKTESQGVVPYLKIANDVTAAINRSGKRRSATCVYLESWHLEIEDFLDLRRNTGDERRRTHDINTANWIPDLFMKRVEADGDWTLFSPNNVPDLHHLYGKIFEERYEEYERRAREGKIELYKVIPAKQLWRKMLSRLFETGHPWLCFKDVCNIRSPQDHVGVVHSSNLCTEITLNTSDEETAVCNLGSINLARHIKNGEFDKESLYQTIERAIRMLDNVIDINFYPTKEAKTSNIRHRPIGLGVMGFQDALYKLDVSMCSQKALQVADELMEFISYHAILSSSKLAKERGMYKTYKGSKWDRNIFPNDTVTLVELERDMKIPINKKETLDWSVVRDHVQEHGMRNSNTMAIAPTATISNISGVFPSIEPIYKNIYVKANISGEFTVVNKYLIEDLKKVGLWDQAMLDELKYFDGSVQHIERIGQHIKDKYKEAFELDQVWLLKLTAARGRWIDQSVSHNVFMKGVSGKKLHEIYTTAWKLGLKTTYYLRTLGASQIEKSTLDAKKFGFTQKRKYTKTTEVKPVAQKVITGDRTLSGSCSLEDPTCESCQ